MNRCFDCGNFKWIGKMPGCAKGNKNYVPKAKSCKEGLNKGMVIK